MSKITSALDSLACVADSAAVTKENSDLLVVKGQSLAPLHKLSDTSSKLFRGKVLMPIGAKLKELRIRVENLKDASQMVAQETGDSEWKVAADIVQCRLRWGASRNDYLALRFFELSRSQRSTYVVHRLAKKLEAKYNNPQFIRFFENKVLFATKFEDFFGRDWVSLEGLDFDTFRRFVAGKRYIIYKPLTLLQGIGVEKLDIEAFGDESILYQYLKDKYGNSGIIEDWIVQHDAISKIYDKAVNPVRIITVLQDGDCNILHATLTIGNGREISNAARGDMVAPISLTSGEIKFPAQDGTGQIYDKHPITGHTIPGFEIPYWDDIIELVDHASRVVPEIGYVGWDVGVTPEGPMLIEGNHNPGHTYQQLPAHLPGKLGNRALYERFL